MPWRISRAVRRCDVTDLRPRTFAGATRLCKVVSVYDGDSIKVATKLYRGEPVARYDLRVAGIDAPEVRGAEHRLAGLAVALYAQTLLPPGALVRVRFRGEDKYGRLLGEVATLRPGRTRWWPRVAIPSLGDHLVARGMAKVYDGGTKPGWTAAELEAARAAALTG